MGFLQVIADLILIIAALLSLIAFAALAYSGLMIYRLVKDVRQEVTEVTDAAKDGISDVQSSARFISESIVKPASTVAGYASAIRATAKALSESAVRKSKP